MIVYGTDSGERRWVLLWLMVVAVIVSSPITAALNFCLAYVGWTLPSIIESPSPLYIFGVLAFGFEKLLWRIPLLRKLGVVKVPDLDGTWTGTLRSKWDEFAVEYPVTVRIEQEWLRIRVVFKTERSASHSTMAALFVDDPQGTVLTYEYLNEPQPDTEETMTMHRGMTRLVVNDEEGAATLEGGYYTSQPRMMYGKISLRRTPRTGRRGPELVAPSPIKAGASRAS